MVLLSKSNLMVDLVKNRSANTKDCRDQISAQLVLWLHWHWVQIKQIWCSQLFHSSSWWLARSIHVCNNNIRVRFAFSEIIVNRITFINQNSVSMAWGGSCQMANRSVGREGLCSLVQHCAGNQLGIKSNINFLSLYRRKKNSPSIIFFLIKTLTGSKNSEMDISWITWGDSPQLWVRSHKYFSVIFALSFALILALYLAIC